MFGIFGFGMEMRILLKALLIFPMIPSTVDLADWIGLTIAERNELKIRVATERIPLIELDTPERKELKIESLPDSKPRSTFITFERMDDQIFVNIERIPFREVDTIFLYEDSIPRIVLPIIFSVLERNDLIICQIFL